jgi:hypothetical protein
VWFTHRLGDRCLPKRPVCQARRLLPYHASNVKHRAQQIYKQEFRLGLGGVSLGNEFNKHTDKEADGTLEAAWEVGVRYFDVAPWYPGV